MSLLILSGRVCRVRKQPFIVNPWSVSIQPCGKKRLILDLRHVNSSLMKQRIKYEDWKIALGYCAKDLYMFSFDLKSGYHHIEISPDQQTLLGFCWRSLDSNNEVCYLFIVLPFDLSTAPYIFTKLLKPLVKHWRIQGTCIAVFLDDGWAIVQDKEGCLITAQSVRQDLCNAGFVINEEKSVSEPTQGLDWLGITWNSLMGTLKIVDRRIEKVSHTIDHIIEANFKLSARELASFTGQIISTARVAGNIGRIMTRHWVMSTLCVDSWDLRFCLDDYCKEELFFWINLNSRNCFMSKDPNYFVYSDASATGGGAFIDFNNDFVCHEE